jgi:hypothetical protein
MAILWIVCKSDLVDCECNKSERKNGGGLKNDYDVIKHHTLVYR